MAQRPPSPRAPDWMLKAADLMDAGEFLKAKTLLLMSAKRDAPARAFLLLALACENLGEREPACFHLSRAHAADPSDPEITLQYADLLNQLKRPDEAIKVITAHQSRSAPSPPLLMLRSAIQTKLGRAVEGLADADAALRVAPGDKDLLAARGLALMALGRVDEAVETYRAADLPGRLVSTQEEANDPHAFADEAREDATRRLPNHPSSQAMLAFALNYDDRATAENVFKEHEKLGRIYASATPLPPPTGLDASPERRLRVGFVSPDLRRHAVVSFLRPLLESYSRAEWEVTCYSIAFAEDEVSAALKSLVDRWRFLPQPAERVLADAVRKDAIDVLIDLTGLTRMHKLGAFALRPAPVQITYLGYPSTTGLQTMDFRIVDSQTDPPGHEQFATESLLRIDPCFLCFTPLVDAPEPAQRPPLDSRPIALGSFNLPMKMSETNLRLWARVLDALPHATLMLKHLALDRPWVHERVMRRMRDAGIDTSRVRITPPTKGYREHLATYDQIDIALDTFPYHGTTTTCEAMWMGVPVVTLLGDRHAARVGASLLSVVGCPELIARDAVEYVRIVTDLARDHPRLSTLRSPGQGGLRARMRASPLCDAPAFAARFHAAVREAWRARCVQRHSTPAP